MEVSHVRNRLRHTLELARGRAQQRRQQVAEAERAFLAFVELATPVVRQLASALKAEGYGCTVFTPEGSLRLAADRTQADFIELSLDTTLDPPQVVGRISYTRGSRRIDEERPVRDGAAPDAITEEELLDFLLRAIEPWLAR